MRLNRAKGTSADRRERPRHCDRHSQNPERLSESPFWGENNYHHRPDRSSSATRVRCPGRVIS
jgi:hypothetical protein